MNLDNLKSGWQQYKVINSFQDIQEEEIFSIIEARPSKASWPLSRRIAQNTLIFSFLLLCVNGGCVS
jgi:hypothetical protein